MIRKLIVIVFCGLVHTTTSSRMRFEQPLQDSIYRNEMPFRGEPGMPGDSAFKREHIFPRDPLGQVERFDPNALRNQQLYGNDDAQLQQPQQPQQQGAIQSNDFYRPQQMMPNDSFFRREPLMQRDMLKREQILRQDPMLRNFPASPMLRDEPIFRNPPNGYAVMLTPCQCSQEPQNFPQVPPQGLGPQNFEPPQNFPPQGFPPVSPQNFPPQGFPPVSPQNFQPPQNFAPIAPQNFPPVAPIAPQAFTPLGPQGFQPLPPSPFAPLAPQGFPPMPPQETFLPMPGAPIITHRFVLPKPLMKPPMCQHMIDIPKMQRLVRQSCMPISPNMQMPQSLGQNNPEFNNEKSPFQSNFPSQTPPQEETSEQPSNNPATSRTPSLPTPLNLAQMSSIC